MHSGRFDKLTTGEVEARIAAGGRFVCYEFCISFVILTLRCPTSIRLLGPGEWGVVRGLPYVLVSVLLGWWGLPWGIIYTPLTIFTNLCGGHDVTEQVCGFVLAEKDGGAPPRRQRSEEDSALRGAWIVATALAAGALTSPAARAGVYFTTGTLAPKFSQPDDPDAQEPWPLALPSFNQFHQDLADYRAAAVTGPVHDRYLRRVQGLEAKEARGLLSLDDRINLGAYYLRLQQPQKAIRVLEPQARQSRNFMLLANLATAYEMAGGMNERALDYRQQALSSWPAAYAGWDTWQVRFYRKAEQQHLTLLKLRDEEARLQPARNRLQPDRLFPRVQFVGPSGAYEPGTIASGQWAEVPMDANLLVMQLLLWMPFDDRLHWLLGELLNASGDVGGAAAMMKEVLNKAQDPTKWDAAAPPELREHYRAVAAEAAAREKFVLVEADLKNSDPYVYLLIRAALAPHGMGLGAGDLIQEAIWPAAVLGTEDRKRQAQGQRDAATGERMTVGPPLSVSEGWVPNWRQLGVGFAAGVLVALFLGMQMRQLSRAKG